MKIGFKRSQGEYRAFQFGPLWVTKAHLRRWILVLMQKFDPTYQDEWTLRWASRRGWIKSREEGRWYVTGEDRR